MKRAPGEDIPKTQVEGGAKMKIIASTTAFTLMVMLAASGDYVPFAALPLPRPANPTLRTRSASAISWRDAVAAHQTLVFG